MNKIRKIELEVSFEHLDLWRFYIYSYFTFGISFYLFFCLMLFGIALLFLFLGNSFAVTHLIGLFILTFLFTVFFIFLLIYVTAENAVEINNNAKYIISNEHIEVIGENFSSEIKWSYFNKIKEKKNHFFLHAKDGDQIMIPKRAFSNQEELLEFKELLLLNFGDEAYLKKSRGLLGLK